MKTIYLRRFDMDVDNCLGIWRQDDLNYPLFTLELSWRYNAIFNSCIPQGVYIIKPHISPRFDECFKVEKVIGRSDILIHSGNTHINTHGCILIGMAAGNLNEEEAVLSSRKAMNLLLKIIKEPRELHITDCWI